jgi:Uma2 family endonuclease
MSLSTRTPQRPEVVYPDSDGEPMAENTLQFQWIVTIKEGLGVLFADRPDVFVAGDLLWYPVEGDPTTRTAPDALVAFGRPKGYRGFYRQWEEGGIAPQVVFEVLSPGNRAGEMARKLEFYQRFGVEEYYIYDPDRVTLEGWRRVADRLERIPEPDGWSSPRLGIRFDLSGPELRIIRPDGRPFLTFEETERQRTEAERQRAGAERQRAEAERQRAEAERQRAEAEHQRAEAEHRAAVERERAERLAALLRERGIDPNTE